MASKSTKQKAENITKDSLTDSSFSIINLHLSSAALGALTVISIAGLSLFGYYLALRAAAKIRLRPAENKGRTGQRPTCSTPALEACPQAQAALQCEVPVKGQQE